MRILSRSNLIRFWKKFPNTEQPLKAWLNELKKSKWKTPNALKEQYKSALIISDKRVIFNLKGNDYRLVTDIEFRIGIVFIIWIGTHKEYDKINVKEITYDKTNKK